MFQFFPTASYSSLGTLLNYVGEIMALTMDPKGIIFIMIFTILYILDFLDTVTVNCFLEIFVIMFFSYFSNDIL